VGPGPRARDWVVGFGGGEEANYRRQWRALHASVLLLRAQKPACQVHDMWAWAPCRGWTAGCGEDEGAHYRGAVACSLCGGSPS
jgi:hypothetical protein